ncbi:Fic family protein [bacterium]|nr:Fic family protein [bacterium]
MTESTGRIEPTRLLEAPESVANLAAELAAAGAVLGKALHPTTAANLADLVRIMNTYYSNLIEGHDTRPREIELALSGELDAEEGRRNLQMEALAHIRVQTEIDKQFEAGTLPEPASGEFIKWLHKEFYKDAPDSVLILTGAGREFKMIPGDWRSLPEHEVAVGRHLPPSSARVEEFMHYFEQKYRFEDLGIAARIMAIGPAHHRLNYIHPFPDGNGRVSRLMSHAMALKAGIGAHGLWSVSRGLARGLESRGDYKRMMDHADSPRRNDTDGRGNLSQAALIEFTEWFLKVCLDQLSFMSELFDLENLGQRLSIYVDRHEKLKPEGAKLLQEALIRGQFDRGEAPRITGLPERSARRVLSDLIAEGLLAGTKKGPVSLRFPSHSLEILFPRLYPET